MMRKLFKYGINCLFCKLTQNISYVSKQVSILYLKSSGFVSLQMLMTELVQFFFNIWFIKDSW